MTREITVTNPDRFDANGNPNERPPKVQRTGYRGKSPRPCNNNNYNNNNNNNYNYNYNYNYNRGNDNNKRESPPISVCSTIIPTLNTCPSHYRY